MSLIVADSAPGGIPGDYFLVMTASKAALETAPEYTDAAAPAMGNTAAPAATDTATTTADTAPAVGVDATAGSATALAMENGFVAATPDEITVDALTGASVYDATEKYIGEISDLILDANGNAYLDDFSRPGRCSLRPALWFSSTAC